MRIIKVLFSLAISIAFIFANPVIRTFINEVQAAPDSLQRIELHETPEEYSTTISLSGYQIKTRAGIATINPGVILPAYGYVTIDATNTTGTFQINGLCDTVIFRYSQSAELDRVHWPYQPASWQRAPAPPYNGSISLYRLFSDWSGYIVNWYIDSTPTFGNINDNWSSISGTVINSQGQPAINHCVYAGGHTGVSYAITNSLGYYSIQGLGQGKYWLTVNYQYNPPVGNYPDSIYVGYSQHIQNININLPISGIEQNNYSIFDDNMISITSPFRNNSKISLILPYANQVLLKLYDTKGSLLNTVFNQRLNSGQHQIGLNTKLSPGIYFLNADIGKQRLVKKIISVN